MLEPSITRLNGSLMVIDRTLAWEVLQALCLMAKMSRLKELTRLTKSTRLVEVLCFRKYVLWNAMHGKKYFHTGIQHFTCNIQRGAKCRHTCKN